MMKQEFEALAGYEVSAEDYNNIIEPMYMATNLDKADFVKCIDKKRFALKPLKKLVMEMKYIAQRIEENCTHTTTYDLEQELNELVQEYINRKYEGYAKYIKFFINSETKQSCYFNKSVDIYTTKYYNTLETIYLV